MAGGGRIGRGILALMVLRSRRQEGNGDDVEQAGLSSVLVPTLIERDLTTRTIANWPNPLPLLAFDVRPHAGDTSSARLLRSCEANDSPAVGHGRKSALIERQKGLRVGRADVVGPGPDQAIVRVLLQAVRGPAGDAADGEDRGE